MAHPGITNAPEENLPFCGIQTRFAILYAGRAEPSRLSETGRVQEEFTFSISNLIVLVAIIAVGMIAAVAGYKIRQRRHDAAEREQGAADVTPIGSEPAGKQNAVPARSRFELYAAEAQRETPPVMPRGAKQTEESPWWLGEPPAPPNSALTQPREPAIGVESPMPRSAQATESREAPMSAVNKPAESPLITPPPLSELRGMLFAPAIKELDRVKHEVPRDAGAEALMRHIEPFGELIESTCGLKQNLAMPHAEFERTGPAKNFAATLETRDTRTPEADRDREAGGGDAGVPAEGSPTEAEGAKKLPPQTENGGKSKGRAYGRRMGEDVQILPSKRGQYKKRS